MTKRVTLAVSFWVAAVVVNYLFRLSYPIEIKEELRFSPQKEVIEILSLGHRGLAADILFIQTVLHTGSLMWKPLTYQFDSEWSYQMMDLATRIDPKYLTAYLFSGMGLVHGPEDVPRAQPILERGMTHFPDNWELPFWMGYLYHIYLEDYETAGKYFWQAAHCPNAPNSFASLMLSSLKKGGHYERAILVLKGMVENTDNEKVAQIYQKRIIRLENMVMLEKAVHHYERLTKQSLANLAQLTAANIIPYIPEDPMGKKYQWDKTRNRVILAE